MMDSDEQIIARIIQRRLVPIALIDNADDAVPMAEAVLAGGSAVLEIVLRTEAAVPAIERVAKALPQILIGGGTILSPDQAKAVADAGGRFGVAPGVIDAVVEKAHQSGMLFIPGTATPTDIERAMGLGCNLLKFFPADKNGGPDMVQEMADTYGHTGVRFLTTGIDEANIPSYLALPGVAAVGGFWPVERTLINDHNWPAITNKTAELLALARSA